MPFNCDKPSQLTSKDIDEVENRMKEFSIPIVQCCTCPTSHLETSMIDRIQCQECFSKKIPMFSSAPIENAYWTNAPPNDLY